MGSDLEKIMDLKDLSFRIANQKIKEAVERGLKKLKLINVNGHRYICCGIKDEVYVHIVGSPGNDLGMFMDGPEIIVDGNAGDGVGNTMNDGLIAVRGEVGDVVGYSMRGGRIYVQGDAGYRLGIHMKEYGARRPIIVVGGGAQDFLGEYMAGGVIVVLRLNGNHFQGRFIAAGIHGGRIFIRGKVEDRRLGFGAIKAELTEEDQEFLKNIFRDYSKYVKVSYKGLLSEEFTKIVPKSKRPFERLYHQTSVTTEG